MPLNKKELQQRIFEISFKNKLSHISSCLTALELLITVYNQKEEEDLVILSSGHAALALYVVLEAVYGSSAEKMLRDWGIHQTRDLSRNVYTSGGSLGQGILIATGMAVADNSRDVYCIVSDGELKEGSCYEALNFIQTHNIMNIKVYVNMNHWGAYDPIDTNHLRKVLSCFDCVTIFDTKKELDNYLFLDGVSAHYHIMSEEEYESVK